MSPSKEGTTFFVDNYILSRCLEIDPKFNPNTAEKRVVTVLFPLQPYVQHFFMDNGQYIMTVDWKLLN